jgi:hypothetical protein
VLDSVARRTTEPAATVATAATPAVAARARVRGRFYLGMAGVLLLIVLVGFTPTLYLRSLFNAPDIPAYLLLHGAIHTAWFVVVLLQTALIVTHRTALHRQAGRYGVGLGVATLALSLAVTVLFVQRMHAIDPDRLPTGILWGNLAALFCFAVFLLLGVVRRGQPDVHKRLMLLAAISVIQPAMARIRQNVFESVDGTVWALAWLSMLVGAMAVNDLRTTRRVHMVTAIGGLVFLGLRAVAQLVVAPSNVGQTIVRAMVE